MSEQKELKAVFPGDECDHYYVAGLPRWPMTMYEVSNLCPLRCEVCGGTMNNSFNPLHNVAFGLVFSVDGGDHRAKVGDAYTMSFAKDPDVLSVQRKIWEKK